MMRRVIVETPYGGHLFRRWANILYARKCMRDCLYRGEAPFLSHLLYPQALNDDNSRERRMGIMAGLAWGEVADLTVVYEDRGITAGMQQGIDTAIQTGRKVEYRSLKGVGDRG
jgi:hypothetical protein